MDIVQLPHKNGGVGYKYPRLEESYMFFFGKKFDGAHDAGCDVQACAEVFFHCLKEGIIKL